MLVGDPTRLGQGRRPRGGAAGAATAPSTSYGAHRIHAEIPATNEAAQKVVTFLGFRHEGTMRAAIRRGDERVDNEVWGLLA